MPLKGKPFAHLQNDSPAKGGGGGARGKPFAHHEQAQGSLGATRGKPFAHHEQDDEDEDVPAPRTSPGRGKPFAQKAAEERPVSKGSSMRHGAAFAHHGQSEDSGLGETMKKKVGGMSVAEAAVDGVAALKAVLRKSGGAGVNDPDRMQVTQATPLMLALEQCPLQEVQRVVEVLLDHGALVNATDVSGNTPLMYCVDREPNKQAGEQKKDLDPLKLGWTKTLLDHGADPKQKNQENPPENSLDKSQNLNGRNPVSDAMMTALHLRKLEKALPTWQPGEPLPRIPKEVRGELADAEDASSGPKPLAVMAAYAQAVEVLQDNPEGLVLDFPESDMDFVPVSNHKKTEPLRKALESADAILRKYGKLPKNLSSLVFGGLLPLQVGIYTQYTERYSSAESKKALAVFVAKKNKRFFKGYTWAFQEFIGKGESDDLDAVVKLAGSFPKGSGKDKPVQIKDALEDVMVDAVRMQRRVLLLAAVVAEKASPKEAKKEDDKATHLVVHGSEPSSKRIFRSHEKVCLGTGPTGLLDVARGGIKCPTMKSVCKAMQALLDEAKSGRLELLRIKMRFDEPSDGGWRDALVNFRFPDDEARHVCELQVMHNKMMTIRADMGAHKDYAQIRGAIEILELHGVSWRDEAGDEALMEDDDSGRGFSGDLGRTATRAGTRGETDEIARLQARVLRLEGDLGERDRYIADLEAQLMAAGPQAAILAKFKRFDKDGDGTISRMELRNMMHNLDDSLSDDEITAVFDNIDKDGSGTVDYQEFVRWVCQSGGD